MKPHVPGRWHAQGLDAPRWSTGAEVVRHLGAAQAQLHDMALWAIGRRCDRTSAQLQQEFDDLRFRRTHVLRPTWHFVDLPDLYAWQALTGERVARQTRTVDRGLGIDDALVGRACDVAVEALGDGPLTRAGLAAAWQAAGIDAVARRQVHLAAHLELRSLVASGPMQGRQHTYQLIDPPSGLPARDDLLAGLATAYGRGHGPFRDVDLAWWSSLTLTDARRAIELAGFDSLVVEGQPHAARPDEIVDVPPPPAALLSNYDEYISYARDPGDYARLTRSSLAEVMRSTGLLVIDGALAGRWRRTLRAESVQVIVHADQPLRARQRTAVETDAERFARFLDRRLELAVQEP